MRVVEAPRRLYVDSYEERIRERQQISPGSGFNNWSVIHPTFRAFFGQLEVFFCDVSRGPPLIFDFRFQKIVFSLSHHDEDAVFVLHVGAFHAIHIPDL